eukprot:gene24158-29763_t
MARVICNVVEPTSFRPKDGFLDFQVSMSPMADPAFLHMPRRAPEVEEVRRILER